MLSADHGKFCRINEEEEERQQTMPPQVRIEQLIAEVVTVASSLAEGPEPQPSH